MATLRASRCIARRTAVLSSGADHLNASESRRYAKLKTWKPGQAASRLGSSTPWSSPRRSRLPGYEASSSPAAYIEPRRALRPGRATVRFETEPAKQLQHGWGTCAHRRDAQESILPSACWATRGASMSAAPCCAEHTCESLVRARCVTRQVWVDNREAVTAHVPGAVRFTTKQLPAITVVPKACRPYPSRTKGKVERLVATSSNTSSSATGTSRAGRIWDAPGGVAA